MIILRQLYVCLSEKGNENCSQTWDSNTYPRHLWISTQLFLRGSSDTTGLNLDIQSRYPQSWNSTWRHPLKHEVHIFYIFSSYFKLKNILYKTYWRNVKFFLKMSCLVSQKCGSVFYKLTDPMNLRAAFRISVIDFTSSLVRKV